MKFYNPKFWDNADNTYSEDQISFLSEHLKVPLTKHNLILSKTIEEWQSFKVCVRENYSKCFALNLWKMVLTNRKEECQQLSLLAQLFLSISRSNSTAEQAFSTLTQIITDCRISMKHKPIEDIMIIKCNDANWTEKENEDIIKQAREIYCEKRRRKRLDGETPIKKRKTGHNTVTEIDGSEEEEGKNEASAVLVNDESFDENCEEYSSNESEESNESELSSSSSDDDE